MDRRTVFSFYLIAKKTVGDYAIRFVARDGSRNIIASLRSDGGGDSETQMDFDTWYHVASTYDGATAKLYINSTETDTDTDADWSLTASTNAVNSGRRYWGSYSRQMSNTDIDEIRMSDVARAIGDMHTNSTDNAYMLDANTMFLMHLDDDGNSPTYITGAGLTGTTFDNDITSADYVAAPSTLPLPVELTSFIALTVDDNVVLNWETATEVNNYGFDVESSNNPSADGWNVIGFVEGHGSNNTPQSYSFVATDGAKYYRLKQIDTDGGFEYSNVVEVESNLTYKLAQNHPNPFNPTTQINFSLPEAAKVSITVFNALGQEVEEITNKVFSAENHSVEFNASSVNRRITSGVYFYRLNSAKFSKTMKMLLIK